MEILKLENVSKSIGKESILEDIDLRVGNNTIYGLVGENGAGKTTLIKMVLGLYKTSKGNIYIDGKEISKEVEKCLKNIGAVIDTPSFYEYLTGRRNLDFFNLLGKNVSKRIMNKIINNLNMNSYIDKPVNKYSLGMKQRLSLAICLLSTPKLLILDEPLNGLDPAGIKELRKILLHLKKKYKMTIIISSHILSELENLCDKVAFIKNKKIEKIIDMKNNKQNLEKLFFKEKAND